MKILFTTLFLFLTGFFSALHATEEEEKIIKSSRDFSLRCRSLNATDAIEKRIAVTVYAEYSSKDQTLKINIDQNTDSTDPAPFTLKYPLDFEVFQEKFDSLLVKIKGEPFSVSYGSHLEVFYWMVTITEESTIPLAGILTTSQYVLVSSDNDRRNKNHTERTKLIKNEIDNLNIITAKLKKNEDDNIESGKNVKPNLMNLEKSINTQKSTLDSLTSRSKEIENLLAIDSLKSDSIKNSEEIKNITQELKLLSDRLKKDSLELNELTKYETTVSNTQKDLVNQLINLENLHIQKVSHVQYQFEKGYLERIQVYIESPGTGTIEVFENSYPIGFSSISNYRNFTDARLYRRSSRYDEEKNNYIFLSDIIKLYENQLNLATRDYSPGDTTVTVNPSSNPITRLNKQRNFYIIDGKTFTDVTGLSESSPNGLVQVELNRRFNLWTHRLQVHGPNNYGFVNYVVARVNFSKIENKLKGLPLRNQLIVENNAIVSPSYATNLDYLRYENLGATFDLNLFLFDAPDFKYTFFLDAGLHYGHTPIIDSNYQINQGVATTNQTVNELDAHNFTIFPRAKVQLFAERRYGLSLSYQANYTWLFTNNRFKQVMSYSGKGQDLNTLSTNKSAHWSHMIEAAFYIDVNPTSSTGKIFTTARFFFQQGDVNTFYPQILLGYAFNIFK